MGGVLETMMVNGDWRTLCLLSIHVSDGLMM